MKWQKTENYLLCFIWSYHTRFSFQIYTLDNSALQSWDHYQIRTTVSKMTENMFRKKCIWCVPSLAHFLSENVEGEGFITNTAAHPILPTPPKQYDSGCREWRGTESFCPFTTEYTAKHEVCYTNTVTPHTPQTHPHTPTTSTKKLNNIISQYGPPILS